MSTHIISVIPEVAAAWAENIAQDNSHGYDQTSRWGPDYDCSSLVITAYKRAGLPLTCTYTGNMKSDMLSHGFRDVTKKVNLSNGAGMERGDILLHERNHTAMYLGNGKLVHAAGNEYRKATGGKTGDQTGNEICITGYFNFPWDIVLRCVVSEPEESKEPEEYLVPTENTYTVKSGDTLSGIAASLGVDLWELATVNKITNIHLIHPGQVLHLPGTECDTESVSLPILEKGDTGASVCALQALLLNANIDVGICGIDGDFGEDTWVAVCDLQRRIGSNVDGKVKAKEWHDLICKQF